MRFVDLLSKLYEMGIVKNQMTNYKKNLKFKKIKRNGKNMYTLLRYTIKFKMEVKMKNLGTFSNPAMVWSKKIIHLNICPIGYTDNMRRTSMHIYNITISENC